jgi:DNA-binding NtrC family response regulator/tetratricopeptide (TPR) repeat protein
MSEILADRFLRTGSVRVRLKPDATPDVTLGPTEGTWIDLASGRSVRIHSRPAGTTSDQLAWSSERETLANLRHPSINPLLDFGTVGSEIFEAFADGALAGSSKPPIRRVVEHATRFLLAHGVTIAGDLENLVFRRAPSQRTAPSRPFGVVLQRRSVFEAIADVLDVAQPGGACGVHVVGPADSGLRTLQLLVARAARLQGYVPIAASVVHRHPWVHARFEGRHVCVLVDADARLTGDGVAACLARLSAPGARRHVVFTFARIATSGVRVIPIDPMGVTAMTGMVFIDSDDGPTADELFRAARQSDGRPGRFLSRLGAAAFEPHRSRVDMVHETSPDYIVGARSHEARSRPRDHQGTRSVGLRAVDRAAVLASQGRHAAATRLLSRAARLLRLRGELAVAARCAQVAGRLALDRAHVDLALRAFEEARDLCPDGAAGIGAATGIGVAWIEAGRLPEAEAALRNAVVAARSLREQSLAVQAAASLARTLYWQGRCDEAAAVLSEAFDGALPDADRALLTTASARVHLIEGAMAPAVRAARHAVRLASGGGDARAISSARRVMAAVLLSVGDADGCREEIRCGLMSAREGRLPLAAVRLRLVLLELMGATDADRAEAHRLATRLRTTSARLPRFLQFQILAVCARVDKVEIGQDVHEFIRTSGAVLLSQESTTHRMNPVAELESFLEIGHTASDDRSALERMAEDLRQRLRAATVLVAGALPERRVLTVAGRPWAADPQIAWRALAGGHAVAPDRTVEPSQAAEPVRYGGDLIAAAACRWIAGTTLDTGRVMATLRLGALAMAPHVRALLDHHVPDSGAATWKDLLGDSAATRALRETILRSARAPFPILIEGESGSGKELVARAIHRLSPRRDRRFCAINCAALSDDLLEAELFGHARGAFTGAVGDRPGLFEDADGGTLFLDEIGELSTRAQAKLLRVLQDGEVRRIGENVSRRVDVRIVAATNRRLEQEAGAGRFRPDLRFRLDVVRIEVPPLRDRATDVPVLASHFWTDAAARVGSRATLSPDALTALSRYDWPGNVRELQNVIAWMAVHSPRRGRIGSAGLPAHLAQAAGPLATTFEAAREEFERRFVKAALARENGHRVRAATSMGITRQGLAKMLRRLRIEE